MLFRSAVDTPKNLVKTRKYLQRAFEVQTTGEGFGFVEILSACPTNWKMSPERANKRVKEEMIPYFPLGIFKGGEA